MKQIERASIFRILSDLIKADAIIDTREIEFLDYARDKYSIKKDDEILASTTTFADAVNCILESQEKLKNDLVSDFIKVAMSDDFCAREEALLLIALRACLTLQDELSSRIISINTTNLHIEPTQILYVESEFDDDINLGVNEHYRAITSEIRLAGFDFVYLPKIAEHYRSIPQENLQNIASFLYPKASDEKIASVTRQLQSLSTPEFCKFQLYGKLGVKEFSSVAPSLMIKVGDSFVGDEKLSNFLLLELDKNVLYTIRYVLDLFAEHYHTLRLSYLREETGRFIFAGFYKQIFDLYMLQKGVRSPVVIDVFRNEIRFPDADVKLEKLHRREKALYTLFLLESASGGINFSKPVSPKQLARYERRMVAIQEKYRIIYKQFGGEEEKAPNICASDIRLPMIALIKKQLKALGTVLYRVDDYMVNRNIYGNYGVNIPSSLCCCSMNVKGEICPLTDSIEWQKISAL